MFQSGSLNNISISVVIKKLSPFSDLFDSRHKYFNEIFKKYESMGQDMKKL